MDEITTQRNNDRDWISRSCLNWIILLLEVPNMDNKTMRKAEQWSDVVSKNNIRLFRAVRPLLFIIVTSYQRHSVSNHHQTRLYLIHFSGWYNHNCGGVGVGGREWGFPHEGSVLGKECPCNDITMPNNCENYPYDKETQMHHVSSWFTRD